MSTYPEGYVADSKPAVFKPVFCMNCVHFQPTVWECTGGPQPSVYPTKYKCWATSKQVEKHNARGAWKEWVGHVNVDKRNKKNRCPFYKRIWWKFWL